MTKDFTGAEKDGWFLRGLGGLRGQRILRKAREKKWIRENENRAKKKKKGN